MGCGRIRKKFIAYLEGSLLPGDRRDFEAHIESCPECAAELKGLSATARLLKAARPESPEPPPGFGSRVTAALEGGRGRGPWAQRWAPATASAVAVGGLVLVLVVGNWHRFSAPRVADELAPQPTVTAVAPDGLVPEPGVVEPLPEADEFLGAPPADEGPSRTGDEPVEPTHIADASPAGLYGIAGGGGGAGGPAPAAEEMGEEAPELAARPVSVGPYNSDDEASRIEEAMALFGY